MRHAAILAAVLLFAGAAAAADYEIYPTNKVSADGSYRGVIDVLQRGGGVTEFRVDRGDLTARQVLEPRDAIAVVVQRLALDPARDRVSYCPNGILRVACRVPEPSTGSPARVVVWP